MVSKRTTSPQQWYAPETDCSPPPPRRFWRRCVTFTRTSSPFPSPSSFHHRLLSPHLTAPSTSGFPNHFPLSRPWEPWKTAADIGLTQQLFLCLPWQSFRRLQHHRRSHHHHHYHRRVLHSEPSPSCLPSEQSKNQSLATSIIPVTHFHQDRTSTNANISFCRSSQAPPTGFILAGLLPLRGRQPHGPDQARPWKNHPIAAQLHRFAKPKQTAAQRPSSRVRRKKAHFPGEHIKSPKRDGRNACCRECTDLVSPTSQRKSSQPLPSGVSRHIQCISFKRV